MIAVSGWSAVLAVGSVRLLATFFGYDFRFLGLFDNNVAVERDGMLSGLGWPIAETTYTGAEATPARLVCPSGLGGFAVAAGVYTTPAVLVVSVGGAGIVDVPGEYQVAAIVTLDEYKSKSGG